MHLETPQIEQIKDTFKKINTKVDLVELLNIAQTYLYPKNKPILIRSLNYYTNPNLAIEKKYKTYHIRKKNGKVRVIHVPAKGLKLLQKCLNLIMNVLFTPAKPVMGFTKGKNVVENAKQHVGKYYLFNTDIQDFFTSIQLHRIKAVLKLEPFFLDKEKEPLAFLIANVCCANGILPQGAPTSPILSNIVCQKLDRRLMGLAKRFGVAYSRYADDITFSAYKNEFGDEFQTELQKIIEGQGFTINQAKTRLEKASYRQHVTGLVVNEKVNVSRKYIREIRSMLHHWEISGLKAAEAYFQKNISSNYEQAKKTDFISVLQGRLAFMKLVKGENDLLYKKYQSIFMELLEKNNSKKIPNPKSKHKPLDTTHFLQYFKNSQGMKYLTHEFDVSSEIFDRETMLAIAKKEFEEANKKYHIPKALWQKINYFAFINEKDKEEGSNFDIFWSSTEVIEWCNAYKGSHPINNELFAIKINQFKEKIEIKSPKLEYIIKNNLNIVFGVEAHFLQISYKDLSKAEFLTDIPRFENGLRCVFRAMQQYIGRSNMSKNKITIQFERKVEGNYRKRFIKIIHHNSSSHKEANKFELLGGDLRDALKAFYGICDWYIEASFSNGSHRISILHDIDLQPNRLEIEPISDTNDFTHILSFYTL